MSEQNRIYFVRHGKYDKASEDISLSPEGHQQAIEASRRLGELGVQEPVVLSSAARRTMQTAEHIVKGLQGEGPYPSEKLWHNSMAPYNIPDLDGFLSNIRGEAGVIRVDAPLVVVAHEELLRELPGGPQSVGFAEIVEYEPGTWKQPQNPHRY